MTDSIRTTNKSGDTVYRAASQLHRIGGPAIEGAVCECYFDTGGFHPCANHRAKHVTGRDCVYRVQSSTAGSEMVCIHCGQRMPSEVPRADE